MIIDDISEFMKALPKGNASALRMALAEGMLAPDSTAENGYALLHSAVAFGKTDAVRVLLQHGADPDLLACNGRRPLHMAFARPEIVALLLGHGANVSSEVVEDADSDPVVMGPTALHWAARAGALESCRLLVEHGLRPSHCVPNASAGYLTPMQAAVAAGRRENARFFIFGWGEDPWQLTRDGRRLEQLALPGFAVRVWLDEFRRVLVSEAAILQAASVGVGAGENDGPVRKAPPSSLSL
jgi:ankyrin repeat protein